MSDSEFDIIKRYFAQLNHAKQGSLSAKPEWLSLGIGDDAAVINSVAGQQLVVSVDTLNEGIHFPQNTCAADIGYKALAVNLSDMAAMGAKPAWFTLSVSLPEASPEWLTDFCEGMSILMQEHQLTLVGGDTTRGNLSITVQIAGYVEDGRAMTRSGALPGDDIYVTGYPGEAAAGLKLLQDDRISGELINANLIARLNRPSPRVAQGILLSDFASACIDVSDGLLADLSHILELSQMYSGRILGAEIEMTALPVSALMTSSGMPEDEQKNLVLSGGDDYELCFTAKPELHDQIIARLSSEQDVAVTRIGKITPVEGMFLIENDIKTVVSESGYDHFK